MRSTTARVLPPVYNTVLDSGVVVPTARWLVEENAMPGTNNWVVTGIQTPARHRRVRQPGQRRPG